MTVQKKTKSHPNVINCFKELLFYDKNIDLHSELSFYEELSVIKQIMRLKDMQCHAKLNYLKKRYINSVRSK